jgi:hypothetical protein
VLVSSFMRLILSVNKQWRRGHRQLRRQPRAT